MIRRLSALVALFFIAPLLSGCLVVAAVDTAAGVGGLAIDATGAVVGTAGDVAEGTIDVITPGDGDNDEDHDEDSER